jgi:hypothetical protein
MAGKQWGGWGWGGTPAGAPTPPRTSRKLAPRRPPPPHKPKTTKKQKYKENSDLRRRQGEKNGSSVGGLCLSLPWARRRARGDAPPKVSGQGCRSVGLHLLLARFSNSLSSQSSYVRRALPPFVILVGPRASSWHDIKGTSSTRHRSVVDTHL